MLHSDQEIRAELLSRFKDDVAKLRKLAQQPESKNNYENILTMISEVIEDPAEEIFKLSKADQLRQQELTEGLEQLVDKLNNKETKENNQMVVEMFASLKQVIAGFDKAQQSEAISLITKIYTDIYASLSTIFNLSPIVQSPKDEYEQPYPSPLITPNENARYSSSRSYENKSPESTIEYSHDSLSGLAKESFPAQPASPLPDDNSPKPFPAFIGNPNSDRVAKDPLAEEGRESELPKPPGLADLKVEEEVTRKGPETDSGFAFFKTHTIDWNKENDSPDLKGEATPKSPKKSS